MQTETILKLNQINHRFYKKVAEHFHTSRQFYWHGWRRLLPHFEQLSQDKEQLSVLDVGCGNGRFGKFLFDTLPGQVISYHGIDFNPTLLEHAQASLSNTTLATQFQQIDLVKSLVSDTLLPEKAEKYDCIVLFGVLHHIPSYQLRKKLLQDLTAQLAPNGLLCLTLWKFINPSQEENTPTIDPGQVSIDPAKLEPHDYFIPWERGVSAVRYCHYTPDHEEARLLAAAGLELIDSFEADGKEGKGNRYLILKRSSL